MAWGRKRLDALAVDEGAVPYFQVEQRPDGVAAKADAGAMLVEQPLDRSALMMPRVATVDQQHLARDVVPPAGRPSANGTGKPIFCV